MRLLGALLVALFFAPYAAYADTVSEHADSVGLTIYHNDNVSTDDLVNMQSQPWLLQYGVGLVVEQRTVDLPAGPSIVRFRNVASTMVPQSAQLKGLPQAPSEQNFDYDLLSPGSLLEKSVGETVHLVRTNPRTGMKTEQTTIVRSAPGGAMLEIDGKLEAFQCSGLPEKLEFDSIPEGLTDTPTLSVHVVAPSAGRYALTLAYLATGLNWTADYVGRVSADGATLDLSGWITLSNFGTVGFDSVPIGIVAGKLNTTGDDAPMDVEAGSFSGMCWPTNIDWAKHLVSNALLPPPPPPPPPPLVSAFAMGDVESVVVTAEKREIDPRRLGDLKLYPLPELTSLPALETKQVQFLDSTSVPFQKFYAYTFNAEFEDSDVTATDAATAMFRIANDKDGKLGKPLPAGVVSVEVPDETGAPVFIGQNGIRDTPVGLPLEIGTGNAMNVAVQHRVMTDSKAGDKRTRKTVDIVIANGNAAPVQFEFYAPLIYTGARIVSETANHTLKNNAAMWHFTLKAAERTSLEYTLEYSDE